MDRRFDHRLWVSRYVVRDPVEQTRSALAKLPIHDLSITING
jgi:hypothetical protein